MMSPSFGSSMLRRRVSVLAVMAVIALSRVPLFAHDMWIEPTTFSPEAGQIVGVRLRVGQDLLGDPLPRESGARSISSSSRMRKAASRSSAATAPIRPASCAWPRPACWSSAITAIRARSS